MDPTMTPHTAFTQRRRNSPGSNHCVLQRTSARSVLISTGFALTAGQCKLPQKCLFWSTGFILPNLQICSYNYDKLIPSSTAVISITEENAPQENEVDSSASGWTLSTLGAPVWADHLVTGLIPFLQLLVNNLFKFWNAVRLTRTGSPFNRRTAR